MEPMSSRKRKKRGERAQSAEAIESSGSELPAAPEETESEVIDSEDVPAFSQITELRPHDAEDLAEAEELLEDVEQEEPEEEEEVALADVQAPKTQEHKKRVLESLIFVSDSVITPVQLGRIAKIKVVEVRELLAEICVEYAGRGIELVEVNGGYQFRSVAASAPYVRNLVAQKPVRLTKAQLETLALIAYRQPITRPEIDDVRGVDSGSAIKVLLERELVKILGRKEEAGRPLLYGTTPHFLEFFGMNAMTDLPTLREFTELSAEHRELFKAKTGEIPDLSLEPSPIDKAAAAEEENLYPVDPDEQEPIDTTAEVTGEQEVVLAEADSDGAEDAAGLEAQAGDTGLHDGDVQVSDAERADSDFGDTDSDPSRDEEDH